MKIVSMLRVQVGSFLVFGVCGLRVRSNALKPEVWRKLWSISGPTIGDESWDVPEWLILYRGARDEYAARGWSWTTEPAIASFHAEGLSSTNASGKRHSSPRIFRTVAPREALLASFPIGGESEIVVDPDLLGVITQFRGANGERRFQSRSRSACLTARR